MNTFKPKFEAKFYPNIRNIDQKIVGLMCFTFVTPQF